MSLRDVLAKFTVQVDGQEKLAAVDKSIKNATASANALTAAWRAMRVIWIGRQLIGGIKSFIDNTIEAADALKHNAERLGITTDELQQYQYVAGLTGSTAKEVAVGFRFFDRALGEAQLGTKGAVKTFTQLGLSIRDAHGEFKPTDEMLFEFADKLKGVKTQAERVAFASKLLGRNGAALLPMLQLGSKALREMFKDVEELGGGFNKDFVEAAHKTDIQLKRMQMGMRGVSVAIAKELIPWIDKSIARTIHQIKVFIDFAKHTYGVKTALMALAATVSFLMGAWLAFHPHVALMVALFTVFAAIVGALYLVFDDLYTSMEGGDAYFTRFLDKLGGKGTALKFWHDLTAAFDALKQAIFGSANGAESLGAYLFKAFVTSIPWMTKWGGIFATAVVYSIDTAVTSMRQLVALMSGFEKNKKWADALHEFEIIGQNAEIREAQYKRITALFDQLDHPAPAPRHPDTGQPLDLEAGEKVGTGTRVSEGAQNGWQVLQPPPLIIKSDIVIYGARDPEATGAAVKKAVKGAVKDAVVQQRDAHAAVNAGMPQSTGP